MNFRNNILILLIGSIAIIGCKKDFDTPPVAVLPIGNIITIDSLRKIYTAFDTTITADLSVYGTVTADEISGNLYKTLYIQDETNAIKLELISSSEKLFFIGDKIRVNLKGTTITRGTTSSGAPINMIAIKNIDPSKNLIKQVKGEEIAPKVVSIADLAILGVYSPYQSQLVQLNDVEFICDDYCKTYAYALSYDANRLLQDTLGNTIIVRTSSFSDFADVRLAKGKGSILAIVSQYQTDIQLTLRKLEDVNLNGPRKSNCVSCPPTTIFSKDFEDKSIVSGGWTSRIANGNYHWTVGYYGGNNYAQITNYNNGNTASEAWLISPNFNLSSTNTPTLTFRNAYKYTGDPLKLMVTTNYDPINPTNPANWTEIVLPTTDWSSGSFAWITANVNISAYKQPNVRFAFKYTGSSTSGSTWEVDDIMITDI